MPDPRVELLKLKNLGPKTVPQLVEVGILCHEDLVAMGTEEAFRRIYFRFSDESRLSLNYLYALEGAIENCDWRWISAERKSELKSFFLSIKL
ncbi:TfoX/Sxy family DNA transformation protein [Kiloniella sp.]|uniref:TfoX/Sxy family DNA transformation protein n=1 Tax=Kiloniella sp. TaxID=1938587 RepID=UPI003B01E6E1